MDLECNLTVTVSFWFLDYCFIGLEIDDIAVTDLVIQSQNDKIHKCGD